MRVRSVSREEVWAYRKTRGDKLINRASSLSWLLEAQATLPQRLSWCHAGGLPAPMAPPSSQPSGSAARAGWNRSTVLVEVVAGPFSPSSPPQKSPTNWLGLGQPMRGNEFKNLLWAKSTKALEQAAHRRTQRTERTRGSSQLFLTLWGGEGCAPWPGGHARPRTEAQWRQRRNRPPPCFEKELLRSRRDMAFTAIFIHFHSFSPISTRF